MWIPSKVVEPGPSGSKDQMSAPIALADTRWDLMDFTNLQSSIGTAMNGCAFVLPFACGVQRFLALVWLANLNRINADLGV